jgi:hypothetical protein
LQEHHGCESRNKQAEKEIRPIHIPVECRMDQSVCTCDRRACAHQCLGYDCRLGKDQDRGALEAGLMSCETRLLPAVRSSEQYRLMSMMRDKVGDSTRATPRREILSMNDILSSLVGDTVDPT